MQLVVEQKSDPRQSLDSGAGYLSRIRIQGLRLQAARLVVLKLYLLIGVAVVYVSLDQAYSFVYRYYKYSCLAPYMCTCGHSSPAASRHMSHLHCPRYCKASSCLALGDIVKHSQCIWGRRCAKYSHESLTCITWPRRKKETGLRGKGVLGTDSSHMLPSGGS